MPNHPTGRSALTAVLLLLCATSLGAQATAGGAAAEPPAAVRRDEVERELARHQAERSRLIAHIESLAGRLESADALDPRQRRQLQGELERMVKQLTDLHARVGMDVGVRLMLDGEPGVATTEVRRVLGETQRHFVTAARAGYVGITLSPTNNRVRVLPGGRLFVRYFDYPAIISVDPSSPAERAGLARGDTVLAYNGLDVRRELPMHELLDAGRPVRVRVRRDGHERTVRLIVAPPPAVVQGRREEFFVPAHEAATRPRRAPTARPGERVVPPAPPVALAPMYRFELARGLAGAELKALTDGLAAAVGVRKGLLVMSVAPRSPASQAGLRDGDIILSANGRAVPEISALSRIMRERDDTRAVDLQVRREKKTRTVRLTW